MKIYINDDTYYKVSTILQHIANLVSGLTRFTCNKMFHISYHYVEAFSS